MNKRLRDLEKLDKNYENEYDFPNKKDAFWRLFKVVFLL